MDLNFLFEFKSWKFSLWTFVIERNKLKILLPHKYQRFPDTGIWKQQYCCLVLLFLISLSSVSAFYAECYNKRIQFNAHIWTKSKFLGMSIGVHNIGQGMCVCKVNNRTEIYVQQLEFLYKLSHPIKHKCLKLWIQGACI